MGNPFIEEFSIQRELTLPIKSTKAVIILSYNFFLFACVYSRSDALLTSSINLATSLLAGFVIFAVLGYMAEIRNVSIDQLGLEGFSIHFHSIF